MEIQQSDDRCMKILTKNYEGEIYYESHSPKVRVYYFYANDENDKLIMDKKIVISKKAQNKGIVMIISNRKMLCRNSIIDDESYYYEQIHQNYEYTPYDIENEEDIIERVWKTKKNKYIFLKHNSSFEKSWNRAKK
jgi:effector-binding domain-containing protein